MNAAPEDAAEEERAIAPRAARDACPREGRPFGRQNFSEKPA